jgi:hypothetical protein
LAVAVVVGEILSELAALVSTTTTVLDAEAFTNGVPVTSKGTLEVLSV